jgi:hypothetical protein
VYKQCDIVAVCVHTGVFDFLEPLQVPETNGVPTTIQLPCMSMGNQPRKNEQLCAKLLFYGHLQISLSG